MNFDKIKGTLVDFNVLEHLLDDQKGVAAWQLELRKKNDDPLEIDEMLLHLTPEPGIAPNDIARLVTRRFCEVTELSPNEVHFHTMPEMRERLGIGRLLKEEKLVDNRPKPGPSVTQSGPPAMRNDTVTFTNLQPASLLT